MSNKLEGCRIMRAGDLPRNDYQHPGNGKGIPDVNVIP